MMNLLFLLGRKMKDENQKPYGNKIMYVGEERQF